MQESKTALKPIRELLIGDTFEDSNGDIYMITDAECSFSDRCGVQLSSGVEYGFVFEEVVKPISYKDALKKLLESQNTKSESHSTEVEKAVIANDYFEVGDIANTELEQRLNVTIENAAEYIIKKLGGKVE